MSMQRRQFIAGLGSAAVVRPVLAQQGTVPVVGYIHIAKRDESQDRYLVAFRQGLRETGFIEGQNVLVEYRFGQNEPDRIPELAADLVRRNVAAIAAVGGTRTATIVKAATSNIPVIFEVGDDPVRNGLVASLSRPGGNLSGVNSLVAEVWPKLFDLMTKLLPKSRIFAILFTGGTSNQLEQTKRDAQAAADAIDRKLVVLTASTPPELDEIFPSLLREGADGLIVRASPLAYTEREKLAALAAHYSIPAIYPQRENAEAGGLMSYSTDIVESWRLVGVYIGRVLKGENPADLAVIQPTKFEFAINLKTAKTLGLEIPSGLLAIADKVIE